MASDFCQILRAVQIDTPMEPQIPGVLRRSTQLIGLGTEGLLTRHLKAESAQKRGPEPQTTLVL
jgi:hypothetical protein